MIGERILNFQNGDACCSHPTRPCEGRVFEDVFDNEWRLKDKNGWESTYNYPIIFGKQGSLTEGVLKKSTT